jgi:hypothetical protein
MYSLCLLRCIAHSGSNSWQNQCVRANSIKKFKENVEWTVIKGSLRL